MATQFSEVRIDLDRERRLKFDVNALAELEETLGQTTQSIFAQIENVGMKELRALLWCGLIHEDPKLTTKQAAALIEHAEGDDFTAKISHVMTKVMQAATLAFGSPGGTDPNGEGGAHQTKATGTGDGPDK